MTGFVRHTLGMLILALALKEVYSDCRSPPGIANSAPINVKARFDERERFRVICEIGFTVEGDGIMTCSSSSWDGTARCVKADTVEEWPSWVEETPTKPPPTRKPTTTKRTTTERTRAPTATTKPEQRRQCGSVPNVAEATVTKIDNNDDEQVQYKYTCNRGYKAEGLAYVVCVNGEWTDPPICRKVQCKTPPYVPNAEKQYTEPFYDYTAFKKYTCVSGYEIEDRNYIYCLSSGKWLGTPKCITKPSQRKRCQTPSIPGHAKLLTKNGPYDSGEEAAFECNEGYEMTGTSYITCMSSGQWSEVGFNCNPESCTYPGIPEKGQIHAMNFRVGSSITFSCNSGYQLIGRSSLVCQQDKKWSGSVPTCIKRESGCNPPSQLKNSVSQTFKSNYNDGEQVTYQCVTGYKMRSSNYKTCSGGSWIGSAKCIEVTCPRPSISNGAHEPIKSTYKYQTQLTVSCNSKYVASPASTIICNELGQWSPTVSCDRVTCTPPNIPNGRNTYSRSEYYVEDRLTISCLSDYVPSSNEQAVCDENGNWLLLPTCQKEQLCEVSHADITYSSSSYMCTSECHLPREAYLTGAGWMPTGEKSKEYLELTFEKQIMIARTVVTGGRFIFPVIGSAEDLFVDAYTMEFMATKGSTFQPYRENGAIKVFKRKEGDPGIGVKFDYGELSAYKLRILPVDANNKPLLVKISVEKFC